jgi:YfiH family protein
MNVTMNTEFLIPQWPAPSHVKALSTTRRDGYSKGWYSGLNLGLHVQDDPELVGRNRSLLQQQVGVDLSAAWLNQTHSIRVKELPCEGDAEAADGAWTQTPRVPCVVLTADCLPVLLTNRMGTQVAAVHAGWRGLCDGILEQAVAKFADPDDVLVWLGPAIGPRAFEVGEDVRQAFISHQTESQVAFEPHPVTANKWLADIYQLARLRLAQHGVTAIYGGEHCTFSDSERFYSYRRDGVTGRQATVIWLEHH